MTTPMISTHAPTHAGPRADRAIRLPVARLAGRCAFVLAVVLGVSQVVGLAVAGASLAGLYACGAVAAGLVASLVFLSSFSPRSAFRWAGLVLAAQVIRMVVALGAAASIAGSVSPARVPFWACVLAGLLAVLLVEVVIVRAAMLDDKGAA